MDPGLSPLADNGGPTVTCALLCYSPAVNAGDNALVPIDPSTGLPYATDQTGAPRIFGGGTVDMGAVEFQGAVVPSTIVNTTTDDLVANALTSLREAIAFASRLGSTVTFDPAVFATPQTTTLVHGPITVDGTRVPVTITGPGAGLATVDAGGAPSAFVTHGMTTLSGLTLTGSRFKLVPSDTPDDPPTKEYVGAIDNEEGALTVQDSPIADNETRGIINSGTLTVVNSTISGNQANQGGGIYQLSGTMTISNSIIDGNTVSVPDGSGEVADGGGIYVKNATLTISNSTISNNSSKNSGGGIYMHEGSEGTTAVVNSIISGNSTGKGNGGGIGCYGGLLTVVNSTISGNSAGLFGGGVWGQETIRNSTIANNTASSIYGGGLYDQGHRSSTPSSPETSPGANRTTFRATST
jgi:predicted outer membrane repeat protein